MKRTRKVNRGLVIVERLLDDATNPDKPPTETALMKLQNRPGEWADYKQARLWLRGVALELAVAPAGGGQ